MTLLRSVCAYLAKCTVHYDSANELTAKITECLQVTIFLQQFLIKMPSTHIRWKLKLSYSVPTHRIVVVTKAQV